MKLRDVARRARVSEATVSRVLNGAPGVRPETRARVLKAAAALHYTPNLNARALAGGRSAALGMIVSNIENPFFLDVFRKLEADARAQGYEVLIANTGYDPARLAPSVTAMLGRRVAGLALVVSESVAPVAATLAGASIPVVLYDGGSSRIAGAIALRTDYQSGMRRIVEYLHDLGHRRMAFVGHHTDLGPLHERRAAFLAVAAEFGKRVTVTVVGDADGLAGGQQAARRLLASGFRPTAIACVNDIMAIGVLREMRANALRVPEDISVTGFDNIGLAEFVTPALTTVNVPREEIGRLICQSLLPGTPAPRRGTGALTIATELIIRDSTARQRR